VIEAVIEAAIEAPTQAPVEVPPAGPAVGRGGRQFAQGRYRGCHGHEGYLRYGAPQRTGIGNF
jgi:hypothetical protein